MKAFMRSLTLALVIVTGLVWSSAQTTTSNAPTSSATTAATTPDAEKPAATPLPAAQDNGARQFTIPAGTEVLLSLKNTIDTKTAHAGDAVYCQTTFPIVVDNVTVIPPGTYIRGEIAKVRSAGSIVRAEVLLRFQTIIFPNGTVDMAGVLSGDPGTRGAKTDKEKSVTTDTHDKLKQVPVAVVAGGFWGSVVGALASDGTGKGAGIGSGIGIAAGLALVLLPRGPDVRIEPGATLTMKLERSLVVDVIPRESGQVGSQFVPRPTQNRLPLPTTNSNPK